MPASVAEEIAQFSPAPVLLEQPSPGLEMAHLFVTRQNDLHQFLRKLRNLLAPDGIIWVSWPKKASGVATEVNEDVIRAEALALDMVDVKVCAIDATWSGLKLVIRKTARPR
jgi:hypothetical protein